MDINVERRLQMKKDYMEKLTPLFTYIPYLKSKEGHNTRSLYKGNEDAVTKNTVPVPVYDSQVLAFVKEAQKTGLITTNYVYPYSKIKVNTPQDERLYISGAEFKDIDTVIAIMAKYVILGMTKGVVWAQAVEEGVWLHCLIKLKELLEIYDRPLA